MTDSEQILRYLIEIDDFNDVDWKELQSEPKRIYLVNGIAETGNRVSNAVYRNGQFQFIDGNYAAIWYPVYSIRYNGNVYTTEKEFERFEELAERRRGQAAFRVGETGEFMAWYELEFSSFD
jgi:integrase